MPEIRNPTAKTVLQTGGFNKILSKICKPNPNYQWQNSILTDQDIEWPGYIYILNKLNVDLNMCSLCSI